MSVSAVSTSSKCTDQTTIPSRATVSATHYGRLACALAVLFLFPTLVLLQGCGVSPRAVASTAAKQPAGPTIAPATANVQVWQSLQFTVSGSGENQNCTWTSSQPSILTSLGAGQFQGTQTGTASVSVTCDGASATANVVVDAQPQSGPIQITAGGTYSGDWTSTDPSTPAVTINTDEPVTIQDSVISGKGTLISVSGVTSGANVTIENVTATASDPGVAGAQRGAFVLATKIDSLIVRNCSMTGVSFGVKVFAAQPSTLQLDNNSAINLEDRASDGQGGFEASRPRLGHFVIFNGVSATSGAEIAWNKIVQSIGQSSTEDVINLYNSQGSESHPISVHDNYMEGSSSPVVNGHYTGTALITDGAGTNGASPTAFVNFDANQVVATAGTGVGIAAGHDISATNNRVVSCGMTASGAWYAWDASAIVIWNYYNTPNFYNNTITGTSGGMVGPNAGNQPAVFDTWVNATDMQNPGNSVAGNDFTDPCMASNGVNLQAEQAERTYWATKIAQADEVIGDQHLNN